MGITIKTTKNFFESYDEKVENAVKQAITNGCLAVEASAKRNCPVDTGNLRASITTDVADTEGAVGTAVEYAAYVEYGTKKMGAKPFLFPALKENESKIVSEIQKALGGK